MKVFYYVISALIVTIFVLVLINYYHILLTALILIGIIGTALVFYYKYIFLAAIARLLKPYLLSKEDTREFGIVYVLKYSFLYLWNGSIGVILLYFGNYLLKIIDQYIVEVLTFLF